MPQLRETAIKAAKPADKAFKLYDERGLFLFVPTSGARLWRMRYQIDGYQGQPSTAFALKIAPYVFARPGELRAAAWDEFDLESDEPAWRVPAARMKMGEQHIVPLARQVVALLQELQTITGNATASLLSAIGPGPDQVPLESPVTAAGKSLSHGVP